MVAKQRVMDAIRRMSVSDLVDLVRALEAEMQTPERENAAETDERSGVGVSLRDFNADKIAIIRAVREVTDLGLREARATAVVAPPPDPENGSDEGLEGAGVPVVPTPPRPSGQAGAESCLQ